MVIALAALASLAFAANDLRLVSASTNAGHTDDHNINIAAYANGDTFVVEVWLMDFDFTLAGAEFLVRYPTYLTLMEDTDAAFQDGNAPVKADLTATGWDSTNIQILAANAGGMQTAAQVSNGFGRVRVGYLVTVTGDRITGDGTTDIRLGTLEFQVNRAAASCVTTSADVRLIACTGSSDCQIFADETASAVATNGAPADIIVSLNNGGAYGVKGDVNSSGGATTGDVVPLINCTNGVGACPPDSIGPNTHPDRLVLTDVNCSGTETTADIVPLINITNGIASRRGNKGPIDTYALTASKGQLLINNEGVAASAASVELAIDGAMGLEIAPLSDADKANGWYLAGQLIPDAGVYKITLANVAGGDAVLPNVSLTYNVTGENAKIGINATEYIASDLRDLGYVPLVEDFAGARGGIRAQ